MRGYRDPLALRTPTKLGDGSKCPALGCGGRLRALELDTTLACDGCGQEYGTL